MNKSVQFYDPESMYTSAVLVIDIAWSHPRSRAPSIVYNLSSIV